MVVVVVVVVAVIVIVIGRIGASLRVRDLYLEAFCLTNRIIVD